MVVFNVRIRLWKDWASLLGWWVYSQMVWQVRVTKSIEGLVVSLLWKWSCSALHGKHGFIYRAKTALSAVVGGTPLGIPLMHMSSPGAFLLPLVWLSEQRRDLGGRTGRLHSVLRMVTISWLGPSLHSCGAQRFGQEP